MAIFHMSTKAVNRGAGKSAIAASAYRSGKKLMDTRTEEIYDYTKKKGVVYAEMVLPSGVNLERQEVWNLAEAAERRKDARVAREIEIALPMELNEKERQALAIEYARGLVEKYGVAADVSIHEPSRQGDQRNHHAHILITTRRLTAAGLEAKTDLEKEDKALRKEGKPIGKEQIQSLREAWATVCNRALERAGHAERIDQRSLAAQGIKREPTIHQGKRATWLDKKTPTAICELNRQIMAHAEAQRALQNLPTEQTIAEYKEALIGIVKQAETAKVQKYYEDWIKPYMEMIQNADDHREAFKAATELATRDLTTDKNLLREMDREITRYLRNTPGTIGQHRDKCKAIMDAIRLYPDRQEGFKQFEAVLEMQRQRHRGLER